MARPKKLDYDSDDFYDEIIGIAMQGLTDAEIVDSLADKFGVSLSPEAFSLNEERLLCELDRDGEPKTIRSFY